MLYTSIHTSQIILVIYQYSIQYNSISIQFNLFADDQEDKHTKTIHLQDKYAQKVRAYTRIHTLNYSYNFTLLKKFSEVYIS